MYVRDDAASNLNRTATKLTAMDLVNKADSPSSRDGSPHTVQGDLVVDGVRVRCFTEAVEQKTAVRVI